MSVLGFLDRFRLDEPREAPRPRPYPAQAAPTVRHAWLPPGRGADILGFPLRDGMVYVGQGLLTQSGAAEPALIDPSLPLDRRNPDWAGDDLFYWPTYDGLTARSRDGLPHVARRRPPAPGCAARLRVPVLLRPRAARSDRRVGRRSGSAGRATGDRARGATAAVAVRRVELAGPLRRRFPRRLGAGAERSRPDASAVRHRGALGGAARAAAGPGAARCRTQARAGRLGVVVVVVPPRHLPADAADPLPRGVHDALRHPLSRTSR